MGGTGSLANILQFADHHDHSIIRRPHERDPKPRKRTRFAVCGTGPFRIKARQQATWASGDFAVIGTTVQIVGELLAEAVDVRAGERVIDVAAGNGNATLAAARRFAEVTSTDYVPALLDKARRARTPKD